MTRNLRHCLLLIAVLTLGIAVTACSNRVVRPDAPPVRGNTGPPSRTPARQSAASASPPVRPAPATSVPAAATKGGSKAASSGVVASFFAIPPDRYYALRTRIAKLEATGKAADARIEALERALLATRLAKRPQPVRPDEKLQTILGDVVVDAKGDELGRLTDVLADASGHVRAAVIALGGFLGVGTRKIAVAWPLLEVRPANAKHPLVLRLAPRQIKAAPTYTTPAALGHELVRAPRATPASAASLRPGASG